MMRRTIPLFALVAFSTCLPKDTRPPPGHLAVTVTASDATLQPRLPTVDGWSLSFERYLVSVRNVRIGEGCSIYYEPSYGRVLSLLVPGAQKLNEFYGLGACDFKLSLDPPHEDSLVGTGVTDGDLVLLRTPGSDPRTPIAGVSLEVAGRATNGDATVTFHWLFRETVDYKDCTLAGGDPQRAVALTADTNATFDLRANGDALFRDGLAEGASLRFAAMAAADAAHGDGNHDVTLDELAATPIAEARALGGYTIDPVAAAAASIPDGAIATMFDFLYFAELPQVVRFRDGGACAIVPSGGDHGD